MLKVENVEVLGWEHAIRGMRNPKNSCLGRKAIAAQNVLMGKKNVAENASKISALAPTISNS